MRCINFDFFSNAEATGENEKICKYCDQFSKFLDSYFDLLKKKKHSRALETASKAKPTIYFIIDFCGPPLVANCCCERRKRTQIERPFERKRERLFSEMEFP